MNPASIESSYRQDFAGPRYTSYPASTDWSADFSEHEYRAGLLTARADREPLAMYAHLPFCSCKCFYCGCVAYPTSRPEVVDQYLTHLEKELDLVVDAIGTGREVRQMQWGGGTPNMLSDAQLHRTFSMFERRFSFPEGSELTVEADPRRSSQMQLQLLRSLGFNRISFGVQDLDRQVQEAIGRIQSPAMVRDVCDGARTAGFDEINLDLIYGLPRQTSATFRRTVEAVIAIAPDRVACFGYTHIPQERAHQRLIESSDLPDERSRCELFRLAATLLTEAGYVWIGLDRFVRADSALARAAADGTMNRTNLGFTIWPVKHAVGVGASAFSEVGGRLAQNSDRIPVWRDAILAGRFPTVRGHRMSSDDVLRSSMIRYLISFRQLPLSLFRDDLKPILKRFAAFADKGLVKTVDDQLVVTDEGRFHLRSMCMELDAYIKAPAARTAMPRIA